jgi:hypothetical protein
MLAQAFDITHLKAVPQPRSTGDRLESILGQGRHNDR